MAKESIETALKRFDERYYKLRLDKVILESFGNNLLSYMKQINFAVKNNETEEHIKNIVNKFLRATFYSDPKFEINAYKRVDSAIMYNNILYAILEMKKPANKMEMVLENDINRKALWEIVYYYLCETRDVFGKKVKINYVSEIRRLIITDSRTWVLINAQDLDKLCEGYIEKLFYKFENNQLPYRDVNKFYGALSEYFSQINITEKLRYVYFEIDKMYSKKSNWQYLFKIFKRDYLLKDGYKQIAKTHVLNGKFYQELLYLMGLKEAKVDKKNVIIIDPSVKGSLANQVYSILTEEKECPEDLAKEETFEIVLVWINRLLFIKLFEGQLISFNRDCPEYRILDNDKIKDFQEVQYLFFDVLGKKERDDTSFLKQFEQVPYLNSSLFERYEVETKYVNIREVKNEPIKKKKASVLGKKSPDNIPLLEYIIDFLNAFSFTAQNVNEDEKIISSEIIDASVLGLIFEKINGYKEGSFYTKSFVTEYICQETIENTVIEKLNKEFMWHCKTIDDVKFVIDTNSFAQIKRINEIIDSLKICDPAVGSGHFLVSALNRIIVLKKELGVLLKYDGKTPFREYELAVIDDVLCVFDGQGREFKYEPNDFLSQSIQKTLFIEKRKIIENCLFGVDINPNAVAICQLRLWIELLKNAYYENGVMETLPNIDINIKCGNSLIHKIQFQVGQNIGTKDVGFSKSDQALIKDYKATVKKYHSASDKREKHELKNIVSKIKDNLHMACQQLVMKAKGNQLYLAYDTNYARDIYKDSFEWALEFPEIISEKGTFLGFDCIIGNPPYIRVQELSHEDVDYYKDNYETAWKRIDISTLFIELGYSLVKAEGKVSFITSNQFLTTDYGTLIRKFIIDNTFANRIVDFADLPVFDGALTYVSNFFFEKKSVRRKSFYFYKVPKLPFIVPSSEQFIEISYDSLEEEGWILKSKEVKDCLDKMKSATPDILKKYAKCWAGAFTGKDDVLMFMKDEKVPFEDAMTIPVIRADSCSRYSYAEPTRKIYYPYAENGDNTVLIPLQEIQNSYPQTYEYIKEHEEILKARKDSRKVFGDKEGWYGLVRFGKLSRFKKKKIVSPGEVKRNKFSLDITGSAFSCGRVFSVTSEDENVSVEYILAFLNSELCEFYLHNTAALKQGGYYSYSSTAIDTLPFIYDPKKAIDVERLVINILQLKSKQEDSHDLEKGIDQIFYDMYGFSEQEQKVVRQYLEM